MESYLAGTLITLVVVTIFNHIRLSRMIDTLGNMLHVFMYHPDELEAWAIVSNIKMVASPLDETARANWNEWDASGNATSEEE